MSYVLTGGWNVVKPFQYIEETEFGVTPSSSPTFQFPGPVVDINDSQEAQAIKYRQIGSRDMYAMIRTGELYNFDVTFNPINAILLDYAINLPPPHGTAARNIGKSLTFLTSQLVNGTEMYKFYKGCRADSIDISISSDSAVEVSISYQARDITTPSTSPGLSTPTFVQTGLTGGDIPWTNLTPGSGPFLLGEDGDEIVVDTPSFSCSITNNLERVKPNGDMIVKFVEPTLRDITFEFDTFYKDTALISDQKALERIDSMVYKLSDDTAMYFKDVFLETMSASDATSATEPKILSFTGTARSVEVDEFPLPGP